MKFQLIDEWRDVLKRAWSVRIGFIVGMLGVIFTLMTIMSDWMQKVVGPWLFSIAFLAIGGGVVFSRLLKQPGADEQ